MCKRMQIAAIFSAMFLISCAPGTPLTTTTDVIKYTSVNGKMELTSDRINFKIKPIEKDPTILQDVEYQEKIVNCSTSNLKCINAERFTFAVQKATTKVHDHFESRGMKFSVISCAEISCETQKIKAVCEKWDGSRSTCTSFTNDELIKAPDIEINYEYRRIVGITELEISSGGISNKFVLISKLGLLANY